MENKNPKLKIVVSVTGEYSYRNYTNFCLLWMGKFMESN